jgi:hypothetical protein
MMQNYSAEWPPAEALKEHAGGSLSFSIQYYFWLSHSCLYEEHKVELYDETDHIININSLLFNPFRAAI